LFALILNRSNVMSDVLGGNIFSTQYIEPDSRSAWIRLFIVLVFCIVAGVGMWSVVVFLPTFQADFGISRADASLPYTLTMIGYGLGGILFGAFSDKRGIYTAVIVGIVLVSIGYVLAALSRNIYVLSLIHALLIGLGTSTTFAPVIAHVSKWFVVRRGAAVGIIASGQYLAGAFWPLVLDRLVVDYGWRTSHTIIGVLVVLLMVPLATALRAKPKPIEVGIDGVVSKQLKTIDCNRNIFQGLLIFAAFGCCIAMAMPQVHMVAFCSDLGYGPAKGAELLSILLACGVASRMTFGWLSDRWGGLKTLIIGNVLQAFALSLFLLSDQITSLYVISILFGLFQGGIVPAYALVVREYFPEARAGLRVGLVMFSSLIGMAMGGWLSGYIFDITGSYVAAFLNGVSWNLLTILIIAWLLLRARSNRLAA
jgi:MFS family permease